MIFHMKWGEGKVPGCFVYNNLTFLALTFPALFVKMHVFCKSDFTVSHTQICQWTDQNELWAERTIGRGTTVRISFYCGLIALGPWLVSQSSPQLSASGWCTLISSGPSGNLLLSLWFSRDRHRSSHHWVPLATCAPTFAEHSAQVIFCNTYFTITE